jgi:hypothetical protein
VTLVNIELLDALRAANVQEELARRAAASVPSREMTASLVTKADLEQFRAGIRADLNEFKAEVWKWQATHVKWTIAALVALTAIFSAIVKLF